MKVLFVTSELSPWVKTGGLADVAAALPEALHAAGIDVRILVPAYPALKAAFPAAPMQAAIPALPPHPHGAALRLAQSAGGVPLYLLECDAWFDRPGNPYLGTKGQDWPDNGARFALLARVSALLAGSRTPLDWRPDVLHCNDWQTGLAPAYLHYLPQPPQAVTVMTVHNLAFQGLFDHALLQTTGLPERAWAIDGVEYHGYLSYLKAGLQFAEAITTVSPTYAREIQTPAEGMGMDGLLRYRKASLHGILNGIDTAQWNPRKDPHIDTRYSARTLALKEANTTALRRELGLDDAPDMPLLGVISRLTEQKGLDLVAALAEELAALPVQLAVLGSGARTLETAFTDLAERYQGQFAVRIGFDDGLAHRIEAGADMFLMPSRFEPCGLNQLFSLRYGTPPIVRATGGLADTVIDATDVQHGNGFVFTAATAEALLATIQRAVDTWHERKRWRQLQRHGMARDSSWENPAQQYAELYRSLIPTTGGLV
jgi:starch synthase